MEQREIEDRVESLRSADLRSPAAFQESPHYGAISEISKTFNFVPLEDVAIIFNVVSALKPKRTLEIGLASGCSALTIMAASGEAKHLAMDPLQNSLYENRGIGAIEAAGFTGKFTCLEGFSHSILPKLLEEGNVFDFCYVDANHLFDDTIVEFFYIDLMLVEGGVIVFDDCDWAAVGAVVNFIRMNRRYRIIEANERTWIAIKLQNQPRHWADFKKFDIPNGRHYEDRVRDVMAHDKIKRQSPLLSD